MKILLSLMVVLYLTGCGTVSRTITASQGNADYLVECPILLNDEGLVATYMDETGKIQPVMATFKVVSGRVLSGGAKIEVKGCLKIDIPSLAQGEDRSAPLLNSFGLFFKGFLKLFVAL